MRVPAVAESLVSADSHTVRFCAANTLRIIGDRSTIPALLRSAARFLSSPEWVGRWTTTRDFPGERMSGALVDLGEDPKEIRAAMRD